MDAPTRSTSICSVDQDASAALGFTSSIVATFSAQMSLPVREPTSTHGDRTRCDRGARAREISLHSSTSHRPASASTKLHAMLPLVSAHRNALDAKIQRPAASRRRGSLCDTTHALTLRPHADGVATTSSSGAIAKWTHRLHIPRPCTLPGSVAVTDSNRLLSASPRLSLSSGFAMSPAARPTFLAGDTRSPYPGSKAEDVLAVQPTMRKECGAHNDRLEGGLLWGSLDGDTAITIQTRRMLRYFVRDLRIDEFANPPSRLPLCPHSDAFPESASLRWRARGQDGRDAGCTSNAAPQSNCARHFPVEDG
ncbi:hypothetical protein C8R45DRAFT_1207794 [Mycena sanguinolenta]|nr:hypothetical protein C8R45DRAFT_1207794 [Mycena sanguinolenta]